MVNPLGLALPRKIVGLGFLKFEQVGYSVFLFTDADWQVHCLGYLCGSPLCRVGCVRNSGLHPWWACVKFPHLTQMLQGIVLDWAVVSLASILGNVYV